MTHRGWKRGWTSVGSYTTGMALSASVLGWWRVAAVSAVLALTSIHFRMIPDSEEATNG